MFLINSERTNSASRTLDVRFLFLCLVQFVAALEVSPDSPCALKCIDDPRKGNVSDRSSSLTFNPDLPCFDWEVIGENSTQAGSKFKDCNNCMKSSGYAWTTAVERDTTWFLFNNRAVVDWCIFGRFAEEKNDKIASSSIYNACNSRCNQIFNSADYTIKENPDSYSFCDYQGNFTKDAESCQTCLYSTPGLTILGNVLTTVMDLCKQKPGKVYNFPKDQEIYAATKITLSGSAANSSPTGPTGLPDGPKTKSKGISRGAIAGIVLGALVGIALILGAILLLLRRLKNKRKEGGGALPNGADPRSGVAEAGGYPYDPAGGPQKQTYAYQPVEAPQHTQRAELSTQHVVNELPTYRV